MFALFWEADTLGQLQRYVGHVDDKLYVLAANSFAPFRVSQICVPVHGVLVQITCILRVESKKSILYFVHTFVIIILQQLRVLLVQLSVLILRSRPCDEIKDY